MSVLRFIRRIWLTELLLVVAMLSWVGWFLTDGKESHAFLNLATLTGWPALGLSFLLDKFAP
ncbi:hypothetical protein HK17_14980 [Acetobacter indonesiensis]|uniref:Uncharacterized protein n=1 Tax=Acetobacter indonesiensis TaxID=104101 RepID=A0A252AK92_9PROT|nr:hypothetical protein HK17_14980 [Acetobacter indonesiensis]